jgi:hypothetical protein
MTKIRALAIKLAGAFYLDGRGVAVFKELSSTTQEAWDDVARLAIREVGKLERERMKSKPRICRIGKSGKVVCH